MTSLSRIRGIALCVALVAACSARASFAAERASPADRLDRLLAGRVAGPPVDCIGLASITSSEVAEGKEIVYRVGSTLYVNEPRSGANALRGDEVLVTRTIGSRLCSVDTIHLVERGSRFWTGAVTLDRFVPYRRPR